MSSIQEDKSNDPPLIQGEALVHVNTALDWAGLSEEHILVPEYVQWTLLCPPEYAWHWTSCSYGGLECRCEQQGKSSSEGANQLPSRLPVTQQELVEMRALYSTA